MKRIVMYGIFSMAILLNLYLIFIWSPEDFMENSKSQSAMYTYNPMYTLDKEEILKKLSDTEKSTLKITLEKLSTFDMESIDQYLNQGNEDGMRKAFSLMKKRLSFDDYKKVKEIFGGFMDISEIENS